MARGIVVDVGIGVDVEIGVGETDGPRADPTELAMDIMTINSPTPPIIFHIVGIRTVWPRGFPVV